MDSQGKTVSVYRKPSRFAFLSSVNFLDIADPSKVQMRRFRIIDTPWFGIYIHTILRPDSAYGFHDHPWSFISIVLSGEFREGLAYEVKTHRKFSVYRRIAEEMHTILKVTRPVTTMIFVGPRRREWGIYDPHQGGKWMETSEYFEKYWPQEKSQTAWS